MSWLARVPGVSRVYRGVANRAEAVWSRDRTQLRGFRSLGHRLFRLAILVVRGVVAHRLGLLAAALTFFLVFSIVPMLVVVLWTLKALDYLPVLSAELPTRPAVLGGDQLLHAALSQILESVHNAGEITGIVGLCALLYVAGKMFSVTERSLHIIAGSGRQSPRFSRALGYLALLLLPPMVVGVSGFLLATVRRHGRGELYRMIGAIPGFELLLGTLVGVGVIWLAVTLLYWSAVRARIPFASAATGGAGAAVALPVVFWAYANLQIGVTGASALGSGFLAFPVFLLWSFSSWYTLLVGAEIAVAHHVDVVLAHGARAFQLDLEGERQASAAIVLQLADAAQVGEPGRAVLSDDDLARALRLPPQLIRNLCARLVDRGLLVDARTGYTLRPDPDRTDFGAVLDAIERDPTLDDVRREADESLPPAVRAALSHHRPGGGPTLAELTADGHRH
jgi:membrane protein